MARRPCDCDNLPPLQLATSTVLCSLVPQAVNVRDNTTSRGAGTCARGGQKAAGLKQPWCRDACLTAVSQSWASNVPLGGVLPGQRHNPVASTSGRPPLSPFTVKFQKQDPVVTSMLTSMLPPLCSMKHGAQPQEPSLCFNAVEPAALCRLGRSLQNAPRLHSSQS